MLRRQAPVVYTVDAGGSRTCVTVSRSGEPVRTWTCGSFAIPSVGEDQARGVLETVMSGVRRCLEPQERAIGCIASSSIPVGDEAPMPDLLLDIVRRLAPVGRVSVVNDVIPLLWAPPLDGVGVVVCSGTGSSVIGRAENARLVKVGGHEHIVSDQGSAYSIAREGLRAAARDTDGTGPSTKLRGAAEAFFGRPLPELGRWLAELPRARTTIAGFAPNVTTAAQDGDAVAASLVEQEIGSLAASVAVAVQQLGVPTPAIGFAGGVLHGSPHVRMVLESALHRLGLTDSRRANLHVIDAMAAGSRYAERLDGADTARSDAATNDAPDSVGGIVIDIA